MSQFQLIPYNRIQDHFKDQMNIALSSGTLYNINKQAYDSLAHFDQIAKKALAKSELIHSHALNLLFHGKLPSFISQWAE
ncbi:hypothetical protein MNBD_NITROSPIRAE01-758 [hydrothermal vent metagenome]|uniref:Transposase IS66 central domain-containing protein n=1 Tax=hydrothermal vent metagenome TaxID=652676 RepID=A0A3B1DP72_9ZZZZ